jgi:hypothetical protein
MSKSEKQTTPNFEPVNEQVLAKSQAGSETGTIQVNEQVVVPSINNTNNTNILNIGNVLNKGEPTKKNEDEFHDLKNGANTKEEKSSAKKEEKEVVEQVRQIIFNSESPQETSKPFPPSIEEVLAYFRQQDFPEIEANKFYNYFKSIGWLVGGKTPMADWPAAARNWMLNAPKYSINERTNTIKHLDTSAGKDYSEPL